MTATRSRLMSSFGPESKRASRECDAFVVILSHASVKSYWVDREVQFARDRGRKVIPVRIDDCKLPPSFDGRDVIDLRQGRGDKVQARPVTHHQAFAEDSLRPRPLARCA